MAAPYHIAATTATTGAFSDGVIQSISNAITVSPATASLQLSSIGKQVINGADIGSWVIPTTKASLYEVRATVTSGSISSGTTGSWLDFSSSRTWTKSVNGQAVLTFEFRLASSGVIVSTQTDVIIERGV